MDTLRGVSISSGTHRLGPENGTLTVRTERTGAVAKAGHDLLLEVTAWSATLDGGTVELTADATSLKVREGTGGMRALDDDDRANIEQTIDDEVLKRGEISFRSTQVTETPDGLSVEGELTLLGATRPLAFDVAIAHGRLSAVAVVKQTDFGMKPYSALFGALKVADEVKVAIDAELSI
jgi:polyisoprenoid-binding protein YceI